MLVRARVAGLEYVIVDGFMVRVYPFNCAFVVKKRKL